ncbi:biosynthetic arginine decarboxylase [Nannocystis pusilla]|uniref:biosynthetic arginine decarboxylase n=1 Tax=Nannocystis pusilla TaxID=889268 RepID=UPI003B81C553
MSQTTEAEVVKPAAPVAVEVPAGVEPDASKRSAQAQALAVETSFKRYGINRWGSAFIRASNEGHLVFAAPNSPAVDLYALSQELARRGIRTPYVVRFPTMIENQMGTLKDGFAKAIADNSYQGKHIGVYPLKVNQRRSVVDTVVKAREKFNYGLEAGSKPELLLAMAQPPLKGSLLVCNGYKDREFMRMAFHAAELGHHVIIVLESTREVRRYLDVYQEQDWTAKPEVGMRAKLYSRGSGRWQSSGGESSKFGLTTNELLAVVRELTNAGMVEQLSLLHFHIGSQITQIKRIKTAVREGARIYAELQQLAPQLRYLDLGGGIGVDYDGSRTSYPSSANYSLEEYASQVVFEVIEACREVGARQPTLLTESGRVVVANHAVTIADLREVQGELMPVPEPSEEEHRLVHELRSTLESLNIKNVEEYFHDAIDYRDECLQLFSRGYLSLQDRASAEGLFGRIRNKVKQIVESMPHPPEEIVDFLGKAHQKYLVNFSIFQSIPDAWSIDQVFPAAPLSRHGEKPTINAQIVDITCDSDGCVETFAHPDENMPYLPLHERRTADEKYYLGFFMTGAYQDSLANVHNLFARCHEVILRNPDDDMVLPGSERVELGENLTFEIKMGLTCEDVLSAMDFDVERMIRWLRDRHLAVETTLGESWLLGVLQSYPYLSR